MRALLSAVSPRVFRAGRSGPAGLTPLLGRLLRPAVGYAVLAALLLVAVSPLAPPVLGSGFAQVTPVLATLAGVLALRTLHALPADALTGSGHQVRRTLAQLGVAGLNVVALLALVPLHGVWGAVWATLGAEALLALTMWLLWLHASRTTVPQ